MVNMLALLIVGIFSALPTIAAETLISLEADLSFEEPHDIKIIDAQFDALARVFEKGKLPESKDLRIFTEYGWDGRQRGCEVFREYRYGFYKIGTFNIRLRETLPGSYTASRACTNPEVKNILWKNHITFSAHDSYLLGRYNSNSYYIKKEKDAVYDRLIIKIDDGSKDHIFAVCNDNVRIYLPKLNSFF